MGWVEYISPKEKTVHIQFDDGKECDYLFNELEEIVHSYAITIHKSQGSEFDTVIMVIPPGVPKLLTKNLLYTGISRAKKKLILIGYEMTINKMIATERQYKRNTNLKIKLREKIGKK